MGTSKSSSDGPTGIADALFTRTQQRVLGLLFGNPARSFYSTEIFSAAQSGRGAVQRELARLEAAGLITVRKSGNQKHYRANQDSPVYDELHGLIVKTAGVADVIRIALSSVASHIRLAFIFGSVAKRTETASSDIDLLIVSSDLGYADLFEALAEAEQSLGRKVSPQIYTPEDFESRRRGENVFVTRILSQPKIWLVGGEGDLSAR
jgi:predicted nucleotidyltransferase